MPMTDLYSDTDSFGKNYEGELMPTEISLLVIMLNQIEDITPKMPDDLIAKIMMRLKG